MSAFTDAEYDEFAAKLASGPHTDPNDLAIALLRPGQGLDDRIVIAQIDGGLELLRPENLEHLVWLVTGVDAVERAVLGIHRTVSPELAAGFEKLREGCAGQVEVVDLISVQPTGWTAASRRPAA